MRSKMPLISAVAALLVTTCGCEPGFFITVYFLTRPKPPKKLTLTVISDCGEPKPAVGTHRYKKGSTITASCGTTPYPSDNPASGTRFVCDGFNASGSNLPAASSATSTTFKLTTDTTITWLWHTEHKVTIAIDPSTINATVYRTPDTDWIADNTQLTLFASSSEPDYVFDRWIVGTDEYTDNPLQITITAPVLVIAKFRQQTANTVTLTVDSAYDTPVPDDTTTWNVGDTITAYVSEPIVDDGQPTRYRCVGWTGTGSVPSSGSGTSVTFTIDQDSTLTWNWQTQHRVRVVVDPPDAGDIQISPSQSPDEYYAEGTALTITVQPSAGWKFTHWSGDASGTSLSINVDVNGPKEITAHFTEGLRIQTTWLPHAPRNQPYRALVWACGGTRPYNFSIISGNLPPGLSLDPNTGLITGTPTTDGTYSFVVRVEDSASPALFDEKQLTIEVSRTWVLKYPTTAPAPRVDHVAAYNSDDGSVLIFGGNDAPAHYDNKTYVWDGMNWQEITPSSSPSPRLDYTLVYAEGKWFLFGGSSGSPAPLGDMWIFDGSDWTQIAQTSPWPSARWTDSQFAYDFHRKKIIIVGGNTAPDSYILDQWEFDVTTQTWQQVSVTNPPAFWMFCVTYDPDRRRLVLFGGRSSSTYRNTTMWFNNGTWEQITTTQSPDPRCEHCQLWEPIHGYIVVFGGYNQSAWLTCDKIWLFDGSDWHSVTATGDIPVFQEGAAWFDYSRGLIYFCCGRDSSWQRYDYMYSLDPVTWEWKKIYPVDHPPAIYGARMTYDPNRRVSVLFGGNDGSGTLYNDIWEWDGSKWTKISVAGNKPDPRYLCLWVYDRSTNKIVMFGGHDPTTGNKFGDTWEYDPSSASWTKITPPTSPSARTNVSACYWPGHGVFMFGGGIGNVTGHMSDCWIYSGGSWTEVTQGSPIPTARDEHITWYDPSTGDVYVAEGEADNRLFPNDVWEFDGSRWTDITPPSRIDPPRRSAAFAFDTAEGALYVFGGVAGSDQTLGDFWVFKNGVWQQVTLSRMPCARGAAACCYDEQRGVIVVFGGAQLPGSPYNCVHDVWEY